MIEGKGPAVLAAGTGWKLFDFLGCCYFNLNGGLLGNETVICFGGGGGGGAFL